jgi:hypothetical protein
MKTSLKFVLAGISPLVLVSCGDSNPFIGKWKMASTGFCSLMGDVEITEKFLKSPMSTMGYTLDRDGDNYIIDTHEPGKSKIVAKINRNKTMTLNLGSGIECEFEREA